LKKPEITQHWRGEEEPTQEIKVTWAVQNKGKKNELEKGVEERC